MNRTSSVMQKKVGIIFLPNSLTMKYEFIFTKNDHMLVKLRGIENEALKKSHCKSENFADTFVYLTPTLSVAREADINIWEHAVATWDKEIKFIELNNYQVSIILKALDKKLFDEVDRVKIVTSSLFQSQPGGMILPSDYRHEAGYELVLFKNTYGEMMVLTKKWNTSFGVKYCQFKGKNRPTKKVFLINAFQEFLDDSNNLVLETINIDEFKMQRRFDPDVATIELFGTRIASFKIWQEMVREAKKEEVDATHLKADDTLVKISMPALSFTENDHAKFEVSGKKKRVRKRKKKHKDVL